MPYYLHPKTSDVTVGLSEWESFDTKRGAHNAHQRLSDPSDWIVTWYATEAEVQAFRTRESSRFTTGKYIATPWADQSWYQFRYRFMHHAHLSLEVPGMVAYTPDTEYGVQDRQLRVRPGKYLKQFHPDYAQKEIDSLVADCKALTGGTYGLTTDPKEIVQAYQHGPSSCMDGENFADADDHPCLAYGGADLALAYIGDLARRVVARAIVWPAKKTYFRVYGDCQLESLLDRDGYTCDPPVGARLRVVRNRNGSIVCPYIDGISRGDLLDSYIVLGQGAYPVQYTSGLLCEEYEHECENCGDTFTDGDEDGATYCSSCEDNRHACDFCGESYWPDSSDTCCSLDGQYSCGCVEVGTCDVCDTEYWIRRGLPAGRCADHQSCEYCDRCDTWYEPSDGDDHDHPGYGDTSDHPSLPL